MFKVLAEPRKRRVCPPRAVVASLVFHLLLLAGIAAALSNTGREWPLEGGFVEFPPLPPSRPPVRFPTPPAPRPESRDPRLAQGQTVHREAGTNEPAVPPPTLDLLPALPEQYSDGGTMEGVIGAPEPGPPEASRNTGVGRGDDYLTIDDSVLDDLVVDTRPELADRRQAELILRRNYPPLLRDIGAVGRTTVQLIIGKDGRVEPGSVRVRESTDEAFNTAAIRAVQRFRFKPATLNGRPVAVLVTIPIEWRLEN